MSRREQLYEAGQDIGREWRKDADPIEVEWLERMKRGTRPGTLTFAHVGYAIYPGEIHRGQMDQGLAWSLIVGDDFSSFEMEHPAFVEGFVDGALERTDSGTLPANIMPFESPATTA